MMRTDYIQIRITHDQKNYAWRVVKNSNIANRGDQTDGSKEMQYTGILGETVFADYSGTTRLKENKGFDDGIDFVINGIAIDLKTMARNYFSRPHFVNNLFSSQVNGDKYKNDIYLFASIHKVEGIFEIVGWIRKIDVINRENGVLFFEKGAIRKRSDGTTFPVRGDTYEVRNDVLHNFTSFGSFQMDMGRFTKIV